MKVVYILPGTGDTFYCQNCMRDANLVRAMRALGHDGIVMPLYLPLSMDLPADGGVTPVYYGAVNCYLEQAAPWFRNAPRWLRKALDARRVLDWAARRSGTTEASDLAGMTISVLRGEDGRQAGELEALVGGLRSMGVPDVVHLANALLLGLAPRIRALGCRVVCSLQDELPWILEMPAHEVEVIRGLMREKAAAVDAFIAVSDDYAGRIRDWLGLPAERVHTVHLGVDPDAYPCASPGKGAPVIGYLSRMSESMGLGLLVDAFAALKDEPAFAELRLHACGGALPEDRAFLGALGDTVQRKGLSDRVRLDTRFDRAALPAFLESLSVLCVPAPEGGAFGLYLLEAMASGVPVVQPRVGAGAEIVETAGGGVVYDPDGPDALASALRGLLLDPGERERLGARGRKAVRERFTMEQMAVRTVGVYERVVRQAGVS